MWNVEVKKIIWLKKKITGCSRFLCVLFIKSLFSQEFPRYYLLRQSHHAIYLCRCAIVTLKLVVIVHHVYYRTFLFISLSSSRLIKIKMLTFLCPVYCILVIKKCKSHTHLCMVLNFIICYVCISLFLVEWYKKRSQLDIRKHWVQRHRK